MIRAADGERAALRAALEAARAATERIAACLDDARARTQYHPDLSPLGWHLGHVAWQEEVWALRRLGGAAPVDPDRDGLWDSFRSRKAGRGAALPLLASIRAYRAEVRARTLELLEGIPLDEAARWTFRFLANHERQHAETMVAVLLCGRIALDPPPPPPPAGAGDGWSEFLPVEGGRFVVGTDDDPDRWDNEQPAHAVELAPFRIARRPVTNEAVLAFVAAGGYDEPRLWSEAGWRWRTREDVQAPGHWRRGADGWERFTLGGWRAVEPGHPAAHLSWYEAEALARWAGARLPGEQEWERAATGADARGANLALRLGDTAPCTGACRSAWGAEDVLGNVWEWTASEFLPWPGFSPGPYRGYSAPWFGPAHKVLRGGCWATDAAIARVSFRNWFVPEMRLYPSGVRLAADQR